MQQGVPTTLSSKSKENRINQLKIQIKVLEEQLESAKRDLKNLQKEEK